MIPLRGGAYALKQHWWILFYVQLVKSDGGSLVCKSPREDLKVAGPPLSQVIALHTDDDNNVLIINPLWIMNQRKKLHSRFSTDVIKF